MSLIFFRQDDGQQLSFIYTVFQMPKMTTLRATINLIRFDVLFTPLKGNWSCREVTNGYGFILILGEIQ